MRFGIARHAILYILRNNGYTVEYGKQSKAFHVTSIPEVSIFSYGQK
jgi:hypothetical protein